MVVPLARGTGDARDDVEPARPDRPARRRVGRAPGGAAPGRRRRRAGPPSRPRAGRAGSPPPAVLVRSRSAGSDAAATSPGRQLLAAPGGRPPPLRRGQLGDRLAVADAARARAGGRGPTPTTSTGSGVSTGDRVRVRSARRRAGRWPAEPDAGVPRGRGGHRLQRARRRGAPGNAVADAHRQPPAGDRRAAGVAVIAAAAPPRPRPARRTGRHGRRPALRQRRRLGGLAHRRSSRCWWPSARCWCRSC